ncbi:NADH-ubiquinone reductase complex 1 MLRQ subunit [Fusarium pseudocircinatum]|uniref:NADH-ubiquinone reductase complex 1 MLRQ subunit n=1 Tax=Fusarium pseudocircinatum TaxID=56676 RepID=A0A8H5KNI1_9HYPO|nr:NADH-ubiquinone reductase complex 1 MLRQ subunit [Fusarium pseudocircinatum]
MRSTTALRMFRQTPRMLRPVPKEDQAGHTISQRLRKLKQIPPELYPLAVVVGFALGAAGYSISRKFLVDKNLRLARQGPAGRHDAGHAEGHAEGESESH